MFYGRKTTNITTYQSKINDAAAKLCMETPDLLSDRQKLLELSREQVHKQGYNYRKGKTRSKRFAPESSNDQKRPKLSEDVRIRRISQLEEDIAET